MSTNLTAVSLFDGIGGFVLALSRAGIRTTATVEIDKAAAGVAADHFPDAAHFDDVTEVTADDLIRTGFVPDRGIVTAGWPCTDISLAGLRLGLGGARSGLIGPTLQLIGSLRPRWVLLENVPGLLSSVCPCPGAGVCDDPQCGSAHTVRGGACGRRVRRGRATGTGRCMALHGGGMGTVLGELGQRGYGIAYRVLDAQHFGVPQRRRRVVIVGCLGDWAAPAQVLLEPDGGGGDPASRGPARARAARASGRVAGDAGGPVGAAARIAQPLTAREGKGPDSDLTNGNIVATVTAKGTGGRRLTPVECERLQGFPDGWTATSNGKPQSDSARYRQLGNSIAVPVFVWVAQRITTHEQEAAQ